MGQRRSEGFLLINKKEVCVLANSFSLKRGSGWVPLLPMPCIGRWSSEDCLFRVHGVLARNNSTWVRTFLSPPNLPWIPACILAGCKQFQGLCLQPFNPHNGCRVLEPLPQRAKAKLPAQPQVYGFLWQIRQLFCGFRCMPGASSSLVNKQRQNVMLWDSVKMAASHPACW